MLTGSLVALATPMNEAGEIDWNSLDRLIDFHLAEGTDGIVVVGTTGESPTVDYTEHCELIQAVVRRVAGRIPVIAGTGGNSTREAIELNACAKQAGANYTLSVVPYYNKRLRKVCISISASLQKRPSCPSSSTTCRVGPCAI